MRKITGYIGAMIIVFALMGSVLLGYALNINGSSAVINEYDTVTDVSGLYSYSDEKTYVDYNPASNYISYLTENKTYKNLSGYHGYKSLINSTVTIRLSDNHIIIDNVDQGVPSWPVDYFICDYFYIDLGQNGPHVWGVWGDSYATTDITITIANNVTTLVFNGTTTSVNTVLNLANWAGGDWDYWIYSGRAQGNTSQYGVFINNIYQISTIGFKNGSGLYISVGNSIRDIGPNTPYYEIPILTGSTYHDVGVYYQNVNYNVSDNGNTYQPYFIFYPRTITATGSTDPGINYTESSRVNNYLIGFSGGTSTQSAQINLDNITGLTNYMAVDSNSDPLRIVQDNGGAGNRTVGNTTYNYDYVALTYPSNNPGVGVIKNYNYKLSDILTAYANIPQFTEKIIITLNSGNSITYTPPINLTDTLLIDSNVATFNYNTEYQDYLLYGNQYYRALNVNNQYGMKNYIECYTNGTVYVYDHNGVKINTTTTDQVYIAFPKLNNYNANSNNLVSQIFGSGNYTSIGGGNGTTWLNDTVEYPSTASSNVYTAFMNITYYVNNTTPIYMDITKGISIKNDNLVNVIWDNGYENGNVNILFRANNTNGTYHNDLTISGNNISIDYTDSRYYVTLNSGDPVDIGTWRNIILDINLKNGKLSAIPVRTFNSFTNVQMDSTSIFIGDLINASPTNIITWGTTTNSLMFNVYQTAVFMDTYGVVMVNPTLDITTYFTDLNNFYRMKIYNFSIYGESMTINGITGTVNGNTLSINDETIAIKEMYVIYADNHAYIEDSHVSVDLGEITTTTISMAGSWYFNTILQKGYTASKMIYEWDWSDFILDNTQFCIFYIGLALAALVIARRFCSLSIIDYAVFIASIIIALSIQVIV